MWKLQCGPNAFIIESAEKCDKCLVIEKEPIHIFETSKHELSPSKISVSSEVIPFYALLGILRVSGERFLVIVTQVADAGVIYKDHISDIFRIKEALFISFSYNQDRSKLSGDTRAIITKIEELLQQGFYFSYHYDLTNSLQKSAHMVQACSTLFDRASKQYVWNHAMSKKFSAEFVSTRWLTPIIQGYVGTAEEEIRGKRLKVVLISRRRHSRAGTRYNARGIDDDGNVANMVETEQIVMYDGRTYSYIQVRGSVPVFWNQTGVMASIKLTRTPEMAYSAFSKHFDSLVSTYKYVLIFDLLSDTKNGEAMLTQSYKDHATMYEKKVDSNIKYCHFDFHRERANSKADVVQRAVEKWSKFLQRFAYYSDGPHERLQEGVVRTSCLDSLDRTNAFQAKIGWKVFMMQMSENGGDLPTLLAEHAICEEFKSLWVHNGNALSIQYSGTASTTASLTKNGHEGILGAINHGITSVGRFFINNFEDDFRQQCIDILLNREQTTCPVEPAAGGESADHVKTETQKISVFISTWNVGRCMPKPDIDLSKWFAEPLSQSPEIIIVGLQEFAPICAKPAIPGPGDERIILWDHVIGSHLSKGNPKTKYEKMHAKIMAGLYICMYARVDVAKWVTCIEAGKVKTTPRGEGTVNGAVMLSFNVWGTSFCMMNCYLASGTMESRRRFDEIRTIYCSHIGHEHEKPIPKHDIKFLFGDLNFRLDIDKATCANLISKKNYEDMFKQDQLWSQYQLFSFLPALEEAPIRFPPTYKFIQGTSNYDLGIKSPAWCDRILWSTSSLIKCDKYCSAEEITAACHKPVYGVFTVEVSRIAESTPKITCPEEVKHPAQKDEPEVRIPTLEAFDMVCSNELDGTDSIASSFVDLGNEKGKPLLEHTVIADYIAQTDGKSLFAKDSNKELDKSESDPKPDP